MITTIPCDEGNHGQCDGTGLVRGELRPDHEPDADPRVAWVRVECGCRCHRTSRTTYRLGEVEVQVDEEHRTVRSVWPDGAELIAAPVVDAESVERATALGYEGSDEDRVWAMTREHDIAHHLVGLARGMPWSGHLRSVAFGHPSGDGDDEERIALLLQRVGREGLLSVAEAGG